MLFLIPVIKLRNYCHNLRYGIIHNMAGAFPTPPLISSISKYFDSTQCVITSNSMNLINCLHILQFFVLP